MLVGTPRCFYVAGYLAYVAIDESVLSLEYVYMNCLLAVCSVLSHFPCPSSCGTLKNSRAQGQEEEEKG
jgi:hypothetical protein